MNKVLSTAQQVAAFNMTAAMEVVMETVDMMLNGSRQYGEENIKFEFGVVIIMPKEVSPGREAIFAGTASLDEAIEKLKDLEKHAIDINMTGGGKC